MAALTPNAIIEILNRLKKGEVSSTDFCPVIQITECRTVKKGGQERVKLLLSDGSLIITGLVSHDCNMGNIADLTNFSVIKVTEYMVQELTSNKPGNQKVNRVLVLINFQKIGDMQQIIGNPRKLEEGAGNVQQDGLTASSSSNGPMPVAGGVQPMQPTAMYGAPNAHMAAPQGGAPMGQVQQMGGGYGAQPAQGYGQQPGPTPYGNVQQPGPATYGNAQQLGPTPYGNVQQSGHGQYGNAQQAMGTYGNGPQMQQQQYGNNAAPTATYGGNQGGMPQGIQPRYDMHRGPVTQNSSAMNITKISDITPFQNNWTIKGRCSVKSDMRRWNKNGRAGCVFNFDLLDDTGEIRCVCFGDTAEHWDPQIQQGKCYTLSKATAKTMDNNKRKWNQTGHSCEITLEKYSKLEEVPEDASVAAVPMVNVKPVKISTIEAAEINAFVDVIAVLDSCADVSTIQRRDGSEAQKRSMTIRDDSGKAVEFTMWGEKATTTGTQLFDTFRAGQHPVLVIKGARVGDFGGKNLGTVGSTQVYIDATEIDGVKQMQQWFNAGGATQATQNLSRTGGRADRRVTTEILADEHVGSGQPAWVKIAGSLAAVRESPLTYPACPLERNGRTCNKKLQSNDDGSDMFTCETCAQSTMPVYRYVLSCQMVDFEGSKEQVSAFGDQGESLMKMPADQAHQNFEQGESDELHQYLTKSVLWRPKVIKIKCAEDTYNEETRIKITVNSIEDLDFVQESQGLIEMIEDMQGGKPIRAMQPKPQKSFQGPGMNNGAFGGSVVPGPFGASAGANPNQMFNPNEAYMAQQQPGFGMQQPYGMGAQPGMFQPQMGMAYQQQPQQAMQQQPSNAMAFI